MKLACVAIVKNEQRHIAEWIAYQFAIGFDTIILLDNQSTDATAPIARAFAPTHDVRVLDWNQTTPDYQLRAYEHAVTTFGPEFAWMAFFDTDEYLVIDPPFDLHGILNLWADVAAIGIPWAMFGSSGHTARPDALLIEAFNHRSEPGFGPNRHIKSIIRPSRMIRCENAHMFEIEGNYRSLAGTPLSFSQDGLLATEPDYTLGKLHHYFTRSRDHWADKMRRGYHDTTRDETEFETYDRNEIHDDTAARYAPKVREILAALDLPAPQQEPSQPAPADPAPLQPSTTNQGREGEASSSFLKERTKELSDPTHHQATSSRTERGDPASRQPAITNPGGEGEASSSFLQERTKELLSPAPDASGTPPNADPVIASEARQSNSATPPDPPLDQVGSPPNAQTHRPGLWALLTEFGTLLSWSATENTITHCAPGDVGEKSLVLWRCNGTDNFVINHNGRMETLDPYTGAICTPTDIPVLTVIPGERDGDVAFRLQTGNFISARPAFSPFEAGNVDVHVKANQAWESFTPIAPPAADLIALAMKRWLASFKNYSAQSRADQPVV
jgi:hypothetical protein